MNPILFSTPMVQAILDGRKTQTRRICTSSLKSDCDIHKSESIRECHHNDTGWSEWENGACRCRNTTKPKYRIGDILYAKETYKFGTWKEYGDKVAIDYKAGNSEKTPWVESHGDSRKILKECIEDCRKAKLINIQSGMTWAQEQEQNLFFDESYRWEVGASPCRWRPSIFMPKIYARIFLKITNVRVERLQDISEEDAIAEGVKVREGNPMFYRVGEFSSVFSAREVFIHLWNSINKKEPTKQWGANPYVFVYEFERVEKPEVMA